MRKLPRIKSLSLKICLVMLAVQAVTFVIVLTTVTLTADYDEIKMASAIQSIVLQIENTIEFDADGIPQISDKNLLSLMENRGPDLWVLLRTENGSWTYGVPPGYAINYLNNENIEGMVLHDPDTGQPAYIGRVLHDDMDYSLALGGISGNWTNILSLMLVLLRDTAIHYLLPFSVLTTLGVLFVTRRVLRGLKQTANAAANISPENREIRLPLAPVPNELLPLVNSFNTALDKLEQGHQREQEFLANAAHELRTPIAILRTRLDGLPDGEQKTQLDNDLRRLSSLANQLLDLQVARRAIGQKQPVDLAELVADVCREIAPQALDKGHSISFDADQDIAPITGDAAAIRRAISNTITNAILHGGENLTIQVGVKHPATVTVQDDGIGLQNNCPEQIFEPFTRGTATGHPSGAGLGLSIVRAIARAHNGTAILAASDKGARFEIQFGTA